MAESRSVLVVDDDEMIRALVGAGLAAAGYEVRSAESGAQALELLETALPDVIVSDVNMPDMDGFALVRALRSRPELRRVPLIFLTSRAELGDVVTGLRLGADDYLAKPFQLPELVARVEAKALRVPVPLEDLATPVASLLPSAALTGAVTRERERAAWSGRSGAVAVLGVEGLEQVRDALGRRGVDRVRARMEEALRTGLADEPAGLLSEGRFAVVLPGLDAPAVVERLGQLQDLLAAAAGAELDGEDDVAVTVVSGWTDLVPGTDDLLERAGTALEQARADPARGPVHASAPAAAPVRPADDDLQRAAQVQRSLLPQRPPRLPGYDVAGTCLPSSEVGGDFFDWYDVPDGLALTLADAMGKGMGAAIMTATVRAVLRAGAAGTDLADAVGQAAATLEGDLEQTATFVTLFHARLTAATGELAYVDAGHGLTYVVRADGSVVRPDVRGLPVGALPGSTWTTGTLVLDHGEVLLLVSDGVLDLFGDQVDRTGTALGEIVRGCASAGEVVQRIEQAARTADRQADDVTVVVVRRP